jgi:hypothetical protein
VGEAAEVVLRFMEPESPASSPQAELRRWREVEGARAERLRQLAANEPAQFALALYREAWRMARPEGVAEPTLFIGVEPGGNFARVGFELVTGAGEEEEVRAFPDLPYLILEAKPRRFRTTLLHETGHAMHALLVMGANKADGEAGGVAPIPHSTAAVTDRRTAWSEGFAIHLETVNAHCGSDEQTRAFYQRRGRRYGPVQEFAAEYYAPVRDLMSYAQNFARYQHVRDGLYAFEAAPAGGDYLRLQLDPARDLRALRSAGAMMANEGVVASVLFHLITAGGCPSLDALVASYRPLFAAIRAAEKRKGPLDDAPLIEVIAALRAANGPAGEGAIYAFLDVTRGATMDAEADLLWAQLFDAALGIEREALKKVSFEIESRRRKWEADALKDASALARRLGPVVVLRAPGHEVGIALFGELAPLSFDINAVGPGVLGLVPGLSAEQVRAILEERRKRPFANAAEFAERTATLGLPEGALVAR